MASITIVGSINADLTVLVERHPVPGETLLGRDGGISAGGKGANQAVAAAYLGADVTLIGAVGTDAYAEPALEHLRASGVNLDFVDTVDGATGLAVITVSDAGENTIVVVGGANSEVNETMVSARREVIAGADLVLLQGEIPVSGFSAAIRAATGRVVINLAPVIDVPHDDLLKADPLVANEHEAGLILSQLGAETPETEEAMARALIELGFSSVVITRGARGAVVADSDGVVAIATPKVDAIDTTGAGDAFVGALIFRLAEGDTLAQAATFAAEVGAFATTQRGAQGSSAGWTRPAPTPYG